ncbi:MAG: immunoglobulin domain-containing protein, partial [Verrucomicrobiota bacterium]
SETIDGASSGGGLNPLPSGSVTVTWSAATANCSALFGGYQLSPPNYSISPHVGFFNVFNDIIPGNEQVYWGFLRDGVNFGPGSAGGNNDQPGYSIDITGLKSLFPDTPFVVELIASSDSMEWLADAFVIDATDNRVQSVYYPSTPPVYNVGDTPWVRGIGGGLSTGTGPLDTDHLKIIGNRAAHGSNEFFSYNFASTIAGFIVTDQPVISMSPQSVAADVADEVTLNGYAVGVPPLSYQWYKDGTPIRGADDVSYTFRAGPRDAGNYVLEVRNRYGSAISAVSVLTINPSPSPGHKPAHVISNPYLM